MEKVANSHGAGCCIQGCEVTLANFWEWRVCPASGVILWLHFDTKQASSHKRLRDKYRAA